MNVSQYLEEQRSLFERRLCQYLPRAGTYPSALREAMEYSLFAGGKRLRPILVLTACEACGGQREQAYAPAAAIEMVHTYSLIHDDLPAMDDDDLRRGKPTLHRVVGDALAILTGDALLTQAFAAIADSGLPPERALAISGELAKAAGPLGMVAGQVLDVRGGLRTAPELSDMYRKKTGALLKAALCIGGQAAGAGPEDLAILGEYGDALGMAYQIIDDILDVQGNVAITGKNTGSDQRLGKVTFVSLYGLEEAEQMAAAQTRRALDALAGFTGNGELLAALVQYLGRREG